MAEPAVSPPLSRRERERQMRRQAILDAARSLFAERGYVHATLDEVAQRAEFGKGTLYNYFEGGKEAILFAIFDDLYEELIALVDDAFSEDRLAEAPLRTVFRDFMTTCFSFFLENRELFVILMREAHRLCFSDDATKVAYFQRQRTRMVDALLPALERGIARGEMKPLPPKAVAFMLLGNINGLEMHLAMEDPDEDATIQTPQDAADFLTTALFDGLLATPTPSSSH